MKKPLIPAVSFVKAMCAMSVVVTHFFVRMTNMDTTAILSFRNGQWGDSSVQTFLIVSGFLLHYHYAEGLELKTYAVKRWRGLFPMFYIAYLYFMYGKVLDSRSFFYYGSPWAYILTLLGMDGYVMARLPAYYIIGEWFMGAIIIMYVLYPLLRKSFQRSPLLSFGAVLALYLVFYDKPITNEQGLWTVSSCLVSFAFGMLACHYRDAFTGKWGVLAGAAVCVLLQVVPMPAGSQNLTEHLMGAALFLLLMALGNVVMRLKPAAALFRTLGNLSYPIFLLHNQIIPRIVGSWKPGTPWKGWVLFFVTFTITAMAAKALEVVTRAVLNKTDALLAARKKARQGA